MLRHDDLPPHLRPHDERPRPLEELPLLDELPPQPELGPRRDRRDEPPPPLEPFLRR